MQAPFRDIAHSSHHRNGGEASRWPHSAHTDIGHQTQRRIKAASRVVSTSGSTRHTTAIRVRMPATTTAAAACASIVDSLLPLLRAPRRRRRPHPTIHLHLFPSFNTRNRSIPHKCYAVLTIRPHAVRCRTPSCPACWQLSGWRRQHHSHCNHSVRYGAHHTHRRAGGAIATAATGGARQT